MKRNTTLFLLAVVLLGLIGCSRMRTRLDNSMEWETETSFGMTYSCFDGSRSYTVNLADTAAIEVEVHTDDGSLKLEIGKEGEEPIYSGNLSEDFSFTVNAQPGEYTVRLAGNHHAGRVELKWGDSQ